MDVHLLQYDQHSATADEVTTGIRPQADEVTDCSGDVAERGRRNKTPHENHEGFAMQFMQFTQVINATPHDLHVYDESADRIVLVLPHNETDAVARAGERVVRLHHAVVAGVEIAVHGTAYGQVSGLPEPQDGVWYVVSLPVALAAPDRTDLLVYGPAVRDDKNRMIGCKGLSVPHHPVAAHPEPRRFRTKEDLGKLYQQGPEDFPWEFYTPYGLATVLFAKGLISKEEIDLAERDFGDAWKAHRSRTRLTLEEAKALLARCYRYQSGEPGHCEVDWYEHPKVEGDGRTPIANGQWWSNSPYRDRYRDGMDIVLPSGRTEFVGDDARALCDIGRSDG